VVMVRGSTLCRARSPSCGLAIAAEKCVPCFSVRLVREPGEGGCAARVKMGCSTMGSSSWQASSKRQARVTCHAACGTRVRPHTAHKDLLTCRLQGLWLSRLLSLFGDKEARILVRPSGTRFLACSALRASSPPLGTRGGMCDLGSARVLQCGSAAVCMLPSAFLDGIALLVTT